MKYFNRNSIRSLRWVRGVVRSSYAVFLLLCVLSALTAAQTADENSQPPDGGEAAPDSIFAHSNTSRYWISGQDNIIFQQHPGFRSLYSGTNSLRSQSERAISNVATLYTGLAITHSTEVFVDLESASGGGLSDALGLAGFTNVDVVRNPELGSKPYLARAMIRQIIALGRDTEESDRGTFALATRLPVRRLELRAGKFGMADFFDNNAVGSDSHLQFMNWTADNNGAYDYAADTRGYTIGVIAEYHDRGWAFRFGEALMPKVANGIDLEWNLSRARAENLELEVNPKIFSGHKTTLRLLSFVNHANMGVYREAIHDYLAGNTSRPEITGHAFRTTVKYGFGANLEQQLAEHWRAFARWGWNEGQHESYAYTEVDLALEAGADVAGNAWHRSHDKLGAAFISNGISSDHQHYLQLGGNGFLLGDGGLNYGRENIVEGYYNLHIWRGIFSALDVQHINHPGYNRDRGPVLVPGVRLHIEL